MSNEQKGVRGIIAKNLLYYRKRAHMTQKELASRLGVGNSAISNWETGVNSIDIDTLVKACDLLGVTINDMYEPSQENYVSAIEMEHLHKYRRLDDFGRKNVDTILNNEYDRCKFVSSDSITRLEDVQPEQYLSAAHNDNSDSSQLEKMQRDLERIRNLKETAKN